MNRITETIAEALYEEWCTGVSTMAPCFKPYTWTDFEDEEGRLPRKGDFYERAHSLAEQLGLDRE